MLTANATMRLEPNTASEFNSLIENEILPMLLRQAGLRDEITFVAPGCSDAVAITFWDAKGNREVSNSTIHKLAARA